MLIRNLTLIFSFCISSMLSFMSTPFVKTLALKLNAIDIPKPNSRKIHHEPIPRAGGLAIFYGIFITIICFCEMDRRIIGILIGASIIVILGLFDDIYNLNPIFKLIIQIVAASIVILYGIQITVLTHPTQIGRHINLGVLSIPVTIFFIVGFTNAVNFIDGLDGLAVGVSAIMALSLFTISIISFDYNIARIALIVAGAAFGFLPYNFYPAKIFMGDTGSTLLGFLLACISILGAFKSYTVISFVVPVLILGLPILEVVIAIFRRISRGKSPMEGDREHIHHHLIDLGLTHRQSVTIIYIASSLLSMSAIVMMIRGTIAAAILIISVIFLIVLGFNY